MSDDFDPILEMVAAALRPAPGTLPDQPSDDELAALLAVVALRFPSGGRRDFGIRRRLPTAVAAAAAAALISTAGVAAAATSVSEPVRLAQSIANEIGLPFSDPNLDDAHGTLRALIAAIHHNDVRAVAQQIKKLRTELGRLDSGDRDSLLQQIAAKTPAIAAQLSNGQAWGGGSNSEASSRPSSSGDSSSTLARRRALDRDRERKSYKTNRAKTTETGTSIPPDTVPLTDPSTTIPPDTTPSTDPSTTIPPDSSTTIPPDTTTTIPPDTTTTIPPDTTTTVPPDTTTTTSPPPPTTTTSLPGP